MKKHTICYLIITFVMTAMFAACTNPFVLDILPDITNEENKTDPVINPNPIQIDIEISDNVEGDSVIASPKYGKVGDEITISYTLANTKTNNRLDFSGINTDIAQVDIAGSGTRTYIIAQADIPYGLAEGVITIIAVFTHTNKQIDTITFADNVNESKTYGDSSFTKAITATGSGTGAITYSSSDINVATVNSVNGAVTIIKAGITTITATKAEDVNYARATASYLLTVMPLQLTISNPTVEITKVYDGNTTAAVTGVYELTNKIGDDTVNVSAEANFNSADVAEANQITVVYSISGADAANYIKPADYIVDGQITKAATDAAVSTNPTAASVTSTSITSNIVTVSGQVVEYAISKTTDVPASGWQDSQLFGGLSSNTGYYLFARVKETANYLAGTAKVSEKITTVMAAININIVMSGNVGSDSVTVSPVSGTAGTTITLSYTLNNTDVNNRLVFSGTKTVIEAVYSASSGTREYVISEEDSSEGVITITAVFTHTNKQIDTITFADTSNEEKTYGDPSFTKAITTAGSGTGAITYSSSDTNVATVNSANGAVTIIKAGTTTITAAKAEDVNYARATASYFLTITQLQLTIANPSITPKVYDGNTTVVVTAGALTNKVVGDTVNVSAVGNFNSANFADANQITVVYSISGASANNYIKPVDYMISGSIAKAAGGTISGNVTLSSQTANSININAVTIVPNPGGQSVEYAVAETSTAPASGWQDQTTFTGLSLNTKDYYAFARAKENANYSAGTAKVSEKITMELLTNTIGFDTNTETKVYGSGSFTKTLSNTGSGTGAITYSSSNTTVATVNNSSGLVTIQKVGTAIITATKAADTNYKQATASYTLTVTKAAGAAINGVPTKASQTSNSITMTAATLASGTGQTVEYAIATTNTAPSAGWQDGLTFSGLTANTTYYVYARAKANDNYNAGTESQSAGITTDAGNSSSAVATVIDFESDAIGKTYEFTSGGSGPTVKVITDPMRSGQKSLQITSSNYNQAAVIPVNLPYELENYQSFSFKFSLVSGTNLNSQSILVYVAKNKSDFLQYGFGNPADSQYNQFAANLLGQTPSTNFDDTYKNKWTDYTITITNPNNTIKGLKGDIFVAIGINCQNAAEYLFDDLTFTPKNDYVPPYVPPPPPAPIPPSLGAVSPGGKYRNMFNEWGKTDAEVTAKVNTTFNKLFNGTENEKIYYEVSSDMAYILDTGNDDVRSEGMSYGMMMCVQLDKKTEFDRLWKWAKTYMYNPTNKGKNSRGYFSWQCSKDGTPKDVNPAPDGEEYFVTALLFASARWGDGTGDLEYGKWARQILYDMLHRTAPPDPYGEPPMFNQSNKMVYFSPYGGGLHTDPSYHLPAFYEVWALELENDWKNNQTSGIWKTLDELKTDYEFYKQAATVSRAFFQSTTNPTTGLGPDYANWDGTPTGGNHADFRFDAWRIAMNIGMDYAWWAADSWQKTFADRIQAFFVSKGVTSYGNQWRLNGTLIPENGTNDHSPGLVGCNAVASLAATHENAWKFIENFWDINMTTGQYRYYDGCLYMLAMLHVSGNFKAYLSSNTTPVPSSSISPTSATFDKKTNLQADIPVTMTLNGNTLTNIKNGGSNLTSGTHYSVSGSNVTIKKEYLAAQAVGTTTLVFTFSAGSTQSLVITVTDTSNSSISPTTAEFDKRTDLQNDIVVTMSLNGNSFTSISNGGSNLTSGTHYSVSGSTVTIKKEYLAVQAVGTTTLVFTFSAGSTQSLVITVKESAQGGGSGTKYDFANDTFIDGYPKYSSGDISAEIIGGVLKVTKINNYSTPKITLSFNLGTKTLDNYSGIKINVKGVSGDFGNKVLWAAVGSANLGSVNNAPIPNGSFGDVTIPISGGSGFTGGVEISFWLNNTNPYVIDIKSIELIPKP